MSVYELILYGKNRLEKEWYQTPKCDQMRQAFEHISEEISNTIMECIIQAYMDCIIQAYNERGR